MVSGRVNATLGAYWNYEAIQLSQLHKDPNVIHMDQAGVPTYNELVFVVRKATIVNHAPLIRRFVQAVARGYKAARANPVQATRNLVRMNPGLNYKLQLASVLVTMSSFFPSGHHPWGWQDAKEWNAFGNWMTHNKPDHEPERDTGRVDQRAAGGTGHLRARSDQARPSQTARGWTREHAGGAQRVHPGQSLPLPEPREHLAHLRFGCPRPRIPAAQQPPDQLDERKIAGRELIHPALAAERQHLDGPGADAGNREQASPAALLPIAGGRRRQLDTCRRHLSRGADQRNSAAAREIKRLKLGRRRAGQDPRRRRIAQPARFVAPPQRTDHPTLDRRGPLVLDQLLGDRPGERLERIRPAARPYRGVETDRRADQGIGAEPLDERTQVEIDPQRHPHPRDRASS